MAADRWAGLAQVALVAEALGAVQAGQLLGHHCHLSSSTATRAAKDHNKSMDPEAVCEALRQDHMKKGAEQWFG